MLSLLQNKLLILFNVYRPLSTCFWTEIMLLLFCLITDIQNILLIVVLFVFWNNNNSIDYRNNILSITYFITFLIIIIRICFCVITFMQRSFAIKMIICFHLCFGYKMFHPYIVTFTTALSLMVLHQIYFCKY